MDVEIDVSGKETVDVISITVSLLHDVIGMIVSLVARLFRND